MRPPTVIAAASLGALLALLAGGRAHAQRPARGTTSLALGGQHACYLAADGLVRCWGSGSSGQLGAPPPTRATWGVTTVDGLPPAPRTRRGGAR